MSQKRMRRGIAMVAVVAALALAPPAQAAGWPAIPPGLAEKAWAWLASWWGADEGGGGAGGTTEGLEKAYQGDGVAIDPDGNTSPRPTGLRCAGDDGVCIDPDG